MASNTIEQKGELHQDINPLILPTGNSKGQLTDF